MDNYPANPFLLSNAAGRLQISFCNHVSVGQFECARAVLFQLFLEDRALALELLAALIRRKQPHGWLCSENVPSSAHLAWLALTVQRELLEDIGPADSVRSAHEFVSDSSYCVRGIQFDILLVNFLLQVDKYSVSLRISSECCQELRRIAYSAAWLSSQHEEDSDVPFLATYCRPSSSATSCVRYLPSARQSLLRGAGVPLDRYRLPAEVECHVADIVARASEVSLAKDLIASVATSLSQLGAVQAVDRLTTQCAGAVALSLLQRLAQKGSDMLQVLRGLHLVSSATAVVAYQANSSMPLVVSLLLRAMAHYVRAVENFQVATTRDRWLGSGGVEVRRFQFHCRSAAAACSKILHLEPCGSTLRQETEDQSTEEDAIPHPPQFCCARALRQQIFHALAGAGAGAAAGAGFGTTRAGLRLLVSFSAAERWVDQQLFHADIVPPAIQAFAFANMAAVSTAAESATEPTSPPCQPTDLRMIDGNPREAWRCFWCSFATFVLHNDCHFMEYTLRCALMELGGDRVRFDGDPHKTSQREPNFAVAANILRPFPKLKPVVVMLAYDQLQGEVSGLLELVAALGPFNASTATDGRSPCFPQLFDWCAQLQFRLEFSMWVSDQTRGHRSHDQSDTDNIHATMPLSVQGFFDASQEHSFPALLQHHLDYISEGELMMKLKKRPIGRGRDALHRTRDLDVLRFYYVLSHVEQALLQSAKALADSKTLKDYLPAVVLGIESLSLRVHLLENVFALLFTTASQTVNGYRRNNVVTPNARAPHEATSAVNMGHQNYLASLEFARQLVKFVQISLDGTILQRGHAIQQAQEDCADPFGDNNIDTMLEQLSSVVRDAAQRLEVVFATESLFRFQLQLMHRCYKHKGRTRDYEVAISGMERFLAPPAFQLLACLQANMFDVARQVCCHYFDACSTGRGQRHSSFGRKWLRTIDLVQEYRVVRKRLAAASMVSPTDIAECCEMIEADLQLAINRQANTAGDSDKTQVKLLCAMVDLSVCCAPNLLVAEWLWARCGVLMQELTSDDVNAVSSSDMIAVPLRGSMVLRFMRSLAAGVTTDSERSSLAPSMLLQNIQTRPTQPNLLESHLVRTRAENQALLVLHNAQRHFSSQSLSTADMTKPVPESKPDAYFDQVLQSVIQTLGASHEPSNLGLDTPKGACSVASLPQRLPTPDSDLVPGAKSGQNAQTAPPYLLHFLQHIAQLRRIVQNVARGPARTFLLSYRKLLATDLSILQVHPLELLSTVASAATLEVVDPVSKPSRSERAETPERTFSSIVQLARVTGVSMLQVAASYCHLPQSLRGVDKVSSNSPPPHQRLRMSRQFLQWIALCEVHFAPGVLVQVELAENGGDRLDGYIIGTGDGKQYDIKVFDTAEPHASSPSCCRALSNIPTQQILVRNGTFLRASSGALSVMLAFVPSPHLRPHSSNVHSLVAHSIVDGLSLRDAIGRCSARFSEGTFVPLVFTRWIQVVAQAVDTFFSAHCGGERNVPVSDSESLQDLERDSLLFDFDISRSANWTSSRITGSSAEPASPVQTEQSPSATQAWASLQQCFATTDRLEWDRHQLNNFYRGEVQCLVRSCRLIDALSVALRHLDPLDPANTSLVDVLTVRIIFTCVGNPAGATKHVGTSFAPPLRGHRERAINANIGAFVSRYIRRLHDAYIAARVVLDHDVSQHMDCNTALLTVTSCYDALLQHVTGSTSSIPRRLSGSTGMRPGNQGTLTTELTALHQLRIRLSVYGRILNSSAIAQSLALSHWTHVDNLLFQRRTGVAALPTGQRHQSLFGPLTINPVGAPRLCRALLGCGLYDLHAKVCFMAGIETSTEVKCALLVQHLTSFSDVGAGVDGALKMLTRFPPRVAVDVCEKLLGKADTVQQAVAIEDDSASEDDESSDIGQPLLSSEQLPLNQQLFLVRFLLSVPQLSHAYRELLRTKEASLRLIVEMSPQTLVPLLSQLLRLSPSCVVQVLLLCGEVESVKEQMDWFSRVTSAPSSSTDRAETAGSGHQVSSSWSSRQTFFGTPDIIVELAKQLFAFGTGSVPVNQLWQLCVPVQTNDIKVDWLADILDVHPSTAYLRASCSCDDNPCRCNKDGAIFKAVVELLQVVAPFVGETMVVHTALDMANELSRRAWQISCLPDSWKRSLLRFCDFARTVTPTDNSRSTAKCKSQLYAEVVSIFEDLVLMSCRPGHKQLFGGVPVSLEVLIDPATICSEIDPGGTVCLPQPLTLGQVLLCSQVPGGAAIALRLRRVHHLPCLDILSSHGCELILQGLFTRARDYFLELVQDFAELLGNGLDTEREVCAYISRRVVGALQTHHWNQSDCGLSETEGKVLAQLPSIASLEQDLQSFSLAVLDEWEEEGTWDWSAVAPSPAALRPSSETSQKPSSVATPRRLGTAPRKLGALPPNVVAECLWYLTEFGDFESRVAFLCQHAANLEMCLEACIALGGHTSASTQNDSMLNTNHESLVSIVEREHAFKQHVLPRCDVRNEAMFLRQFFHGAVETGPMPMRRYLVITCEYYAQPKQKFEQETCRYQRLQALLSFQVLGRFFQDAANTCETLFALCEDVPTRASLMQRGQIYLMQAIAQAETIAEGGDYGRSALTTLRARLHLFTLQTEVVEVLTAAIARENDQRQARLTLRPSNAKASHQHGRQRAICEEAHKRLPITASLSQLDSRATCLLAVDEGGNRLPWDSKQVVQQQCLVVDYLWSWKDSVPRARQLAQKIIAELALGDLRPYLT